MSSLCCRARAQRDVFHIAGTMCHEQSTINSEFTVHSAAAAGSANTLVNNALPFVPHHFVWKWRRVKAAFYVDEAH